MVGHTKYAENGRIICYAKQENYKSWVGSMSCKHLGTDYFYSHCPQRLGASLRKRKRQLAVKLQLTQLIIQQMTFKKSDNIKKINPMAEQTTSNKKQNRFEKM